MDDAQIPVARRESDWVAAGSDPPLGEVVEVPLDTLCAEDSPRAAGVDPAHARMLAETDAPLPPILVHRPTMRVIDGLHRLQAAKLKNAVAIDARFFDGDDQAAFILAVKSNITHGLPLSLADRKTAARRILEVRPQWSDRAIAAVTGLSHKTVGKVRRSTGEVPQPNAHIGRDGRVRALDPAQGRRRAHELIASNPTASIREIARGAGVSVATAHDVRHRHGRREEPARTVTRPRPRQADAVDLASAQIADNQAAVERLRSDPTIRYTESGRTLVRLLDGHLNDRDQWDQVARNIPEHRLELISELAKARAEDWRQFVELLQKRRR
ncbi:ParB/RepB/Spo0J family partition protein [Amycolatopsis thailandensis]|uniref:ParB/RepB/Spo0J family partition protein n=1 Tax=Amycolatopsis thailandensis TaxID=589330 RepID=UPI001FC9969B|nr:ParB/RepB/Spo0J family partition protein [Amycolatopsis thailandensis]